MTDPVPMDDTVPADDANPYPDLDDQALLAAYDAQLRDTAEVPGADAWVRIGPVVAATYALGRGFVSYRALTDDRGTPLTSPGIADLVSEVMAHFAEAAATEVEWKTRGHDHAPGLAEALRRAGFVAEDTEAIMIGEARLLAEVLPVPPGVTIRRITAEQDVHRMALMQDEVFGRAMPGMTEDLLRRLGSGLDDLELWVAETAAAQHADPAAAGSQAGEIICAGRLEPVAATDFAGIWGGCTRPQWRHRGVYRALTAHRARSALARGKRFLHSDSTEYSRPILERSGFRRVGATTPYLWRRERLGRIGA